MTRPSFSPAHRTIAVAVALAAWLPAHALRGADVPPPTPEAVRAANPKPSTAVAAVAPALREGRVTAVSPAADRVEIDGSWYLIADGRTQVLRDGGKAAPSGLATGQRVGFGVMAAPSEQRTLAEIHVR